MQLPTYSTWNRSAPWWSETEVVNSAVIHGQFRRSGSPLKFGSGLAVPRPFPSWLSEGHCQNTHSRRLWGACVVVSNLSIGEPTVVCWRTAFRPRTYYDSSLWFSIGHISSLVPLISAPSTYGRRQTKSCTFRENINSQRKSCSTSSELSATVWSRPCLNWF